VGLKSVIEKEFGNPKINSFEMAGNMIELKIWNAPKKKAGSMKTSLLYLT
jgi:hypothetical protein